MDTKRKTKKDKAKRNKELNGKYSQKHLRQVEDLKRKRNGVIKLETKSKNKNLEYL